MLHPRGVRSVELPRDGVAIMSLNELVANVVPSPLETRSIVIGGRRTSIRLDPYHWKSLMEICANERISASSLLGIIMKRLEDMRRNDSRDTLALVDDDDGADGDEGRRDGTEKKSGAVTLTSTVRVFLLAYYSNRAKLKTETYGNMESERAANERSKET